VGLTRVDTLGFRGEGLASIAAVAKVTIVSRTGGAEVATALDVHADELGEPRPVAGPLGTRVVVRELFGNVPVRRDYLRSPSAEFARISSWLATLALAYPYVGFTLEHDGKPAFAFAPGDDLAPRLRHVFGTSSSTMVPIRAGDAHAGVSGWVSSPDDDRPDRRSQILFVNGRLLRSTLVSGAWSAAYRTFAMVGRYPYGVLYLTVPPHEVDPNVHPTKSDVRLRYGDRVLAAVRDAIGMALRRGAVERLERSISFAPPTGELAGGSVQIDWADTFTPGTNGANAEKKTLRVLAQVDRTFILASDGDAVVLIDQHAAHERIVFEQLSANARAHAAAEPLLIPYTFEVRPEDADRLDGTLDALAAGGLHVEPFGERAYRVTATPARLVHAGRTRPFDVAQFVDLLGDDARGLDADQRVWASLACHSVVRAHEALEYAEMTALVDRLQRCENPMHCPHGRPTIVRLEAERIAALFKRV
jgi:DNA mismatch repair protein MutL